MADSFKTSIDPDLFRIHRESDMRERAGWPDRDLVLRLASNNVVVGAHLNAWRMGAVSWESTLIAIVRDLATLNQKLSEALVRSAIAIPPSIFTSATPAKSERHQER